MRRGEIAISVVVIIALSLLVLTIIAVVLVDTFSDAQENINNCQALYEGNCMARSICDSTQGSRVVEGIECGASATYDYGYTVVESFPEGGAVCCVRR